MTGNRKASRQGSTGAAIHRRSLLCLGLLVAVVASLGCAQENKGIPHPTNRLHFPVSIAAGPSGDYIYVVNSDFDMRYRTGSVVAIDLDTHELVSTSAVGVGPFAGELALYETGDPERPLAGYVPSRSEGTLYWFTIAKNSDGVPTLNCRSTPPQHADEIPECDATFRVGKVQRPRLPADDEGLSDEDKAKLAGEPVTMSLGLDVFGASVYRKDIGDDYLLVSNPRTGRVSVFSIGGDTPVDPDTPGQPAAWAPGASWPRLSSPGEPVFVQSITVGGGAYGVTASPEDDFIYTTNKFVNVVVPFQLREIADPDGAPRVWPEAQAFSGFAISNSSISGDYGRSLAFSRNGSHAYLAYRNPSSLVVIDTSQKDNGAAVDRFIGAVDVGAGPADVIRAASGKNGSDLLYVVCFDDEQIYVVDPATLSVVDIIDVPGGPFDMAVVDAPDKGRFRGYVTLFEKDAVAVIELDHASQFYHKLIAPIPSVDDEGAHK